MREAMAVQQQRYILRRPGSWIVGAFLGLAVLAPTPVVIAGTDSTASAGVPQRDPALRWQFDTGV